MDVIAHTLWTNALFHAKYHQQKKLRYLAAFFGVAPDLIGFSPLFIYLIFSGRIFHGFPFTGPQNWTFGFAEQAYNYTHSLVVFGFFFIVVHLVLNFALTASRRAALRVKLSTGNDPSKPGWILFWPMLGWALHILIDIPTHPDFYSTPFLYPLSHFRNHHGISWGDPIFMLVNYSLIIGVYLGLYIYQKRKYGPSRQP